MHSIFRIVLRISAETQSKAILLRGAERPSARPAATPRALYTRRAQWQPVHVRQDLDHLVRCVETGAEGLLQLDDVALLHRCRRDPAESREDVVAQNTGGLTRAIGSCTAIAI